jgi:hypothetical protein
MEPRRAVTALAALAHTHPLGLYRLSAIQTGKVLLELTVHIVGRRNPRTGDEAILQDQ